MRFIRYVYWLKATHIYSTKTVSAHRKLRTAFDSSLIQIVNSPQLMMFALGSVGPLHMASISHIPPIWFHLLSSSSRAQWGCVGFGLNLRLLLISCLANLCTSLDNKFYIYVKHKQKRTESHIRLTICCLPFSRIFLPPTICHLFLNSPASFALCPPPAV